MPLFKAEMDKVSAQMPETEFELLFVDDGSRDGTRTVLANLAASDSRVRVLSFARNFGKEAALLAGLVNAAGDLVAVMDADLQDPPALLPRMLSILTETGCDCVGTRRVTRAGEPPIRSAFARTFYRVISQLSPVPVLDGVRDFRLMRREMVDAILRLTERRRFSKGLFAWVGFDVQYIEYENIERAAGQTKWSFWGLLRYALEGLFSLSAAPLKLPLLLALVSFAACIVLLCLGCPVAALLCALAACVLGGIFVLGQYLARVYWEIKKRPLYVLKEDRTSAS